MSVIKHEEQRVAVFIDTQNLYHCAKNIYKSKVNFEEVLKTAVGGRKLVRALSYVVTTESGEEQPFFEALEKIGIEVKTKDLLIFSGGAKKADWDVGMAVDAIIHAQKVDAIVLATGDGDFVPLVEYVRGQGCQVEAISFGKSSSSRLIEVVDDFIDMDENPNQYLIGKRKRGIKKQIQQIVGTDTDDMK
ncbi:NYN domain-containing protein [bacterium]|nr:NYN domain-containing protein [bacterium]